MKLKKKMSKAKDEEIEVIEQEVSEVVGEIESEMEEVCINRSDLVRALLLAVFSRSHLLIEGEPGTAKTYVVRKFIEHLSPELSRFKILLTKDTVSDAVIGPVHLGDLRAKSIFRYNTTNMLPEAEFAMLEEVYRARGTVLDSMLTVLNERIFMNAGQEIECPLCSAFGTTNFVSKDSEGEAFLDRWAIHFKVDPIPAEMREKLFCIPTRSLEALSKLTRNHLIKAKKTQIKVPGNVLDFYLELVSSLENAKSLFTRKITDRRLADTMKLIKAEAFMHGRSEVEIADVFVARFGLTLVGDKQEDAEFSKIYEQLEKKYANIIKEGELTSVDSRLVTEWLAKAKAQIDLGPEDPNGQTRERYKRYYDIGTDLQARLTGVTDIEFTPSNTFKKRRDALLRRVEDALGKFKF